MPNQIKNLIFSIIGGDNRQLELIKIIKEKGGTVKVLGFPTSLVKEKVILDENDTVYDKLTRETVQADIIFLPIPYKDKDGYINMKYDTQKLTVFELLSHIGNNSLVILGKQDSVICQEASCNGIHIVDLVDLEEFSVLNAIPSAEGAIQIAMENSNRTLHGSHCLVMGYGRIGKVLARMLKGIGANVTVEARKYLDLIWIKENGYTPVHLSEIQSVLPKQDFIFNTIPHLILNKDLLKKVNKDVLIIDLASYPGGVDFNAANELGIRARLDLGLPGIVAPQTAAEIILEVTMEIFNKAHA